MPINLTVAGSFLVVCFVCFGVPMTYNNVIETA